MSIHDNTLFYRTCDWNNEPNEDLILGKFRKDLKTKSNEYSATGEGGMLDQENNQNLKENNLRNSEFFLKKKENKKFLKGHKKKKY